MRFGLKRRKQFRISCSNCGRSHGIEALQERTSSEDITDIGLECPRCGVWTHAYYRSHELEAAAEKLQEAKERFQRRRTPKAWERYKSIQREYQQVFDELQERMNGCS